MNISWDFVFKLMVECWENFRFVEEDDDVDMGVVRVESFVASILGRYVEDGTED